MDVSARCPKVCQVPGGVKSQGRIVVPASELPVGVPRPIVSAFSPSCGPSARSVSCQVGPSGPCLSVFFCNLIEKLRLRSQTAHHYPSSCSCPWRIKHVPCLRYPGKEPILIYLAAHIGSQNTLSSGALQCLMSKDRDRLTTSADTGLTRQPVIPPRRHLDRQKRRPLESHHWLFCHTPQAQTCLQVIRVHEARLTDMGAKLCARSRTTGHPFALLDAVRCESFGRR